jgi:hypothetical protein
MPRGIRSLQLRHGKATGVRFREGASGLRVLEKLGFAFERRAVTGGLDTLSIERRERK